MFWTSLTCSFVHRYLPIKVEHVELACVNECVRHRVEDCCAIVVARETFALGAPNVRRRRFSRRKGTPLDDAIATILTHVLASAVPPMRLLHAWGVPMTSWLVTDTSGPRTSARSCLRPSRRLAGCNDDVAASLKRKKARWHRQLAQP